MNFDKFARRLGVSKLGAFVRAVFCGLVCFCSFLFQDFALAQAQDSGTKYGSELSVQFGTLLPDQISGVTEILPVGGVFYKIPVAGAGLEFGLLNTHAKGVDFTTFPIRGRFELPLDEYMTAMVFAGPEVNYYSPVDTTDRQTVVGFHLGGGAMYHVLETLWFRAEMKYSFNPGDSLYFGFGVSFRSPDGGGGG